MRQINTTRFAVFAILAVLALSTGCTTTLRNKQLERVAKDWALVIRASQVIPVYPLSEDLQPGDVLLVSTPIEEQVAIYKEKGFLPLDQHLVRLYSKDFKEFYDSRYGIDDKTIPPGNWQKLNSEGKHNWEIAPHAAFPTYQFSVETGSGLNLAIPIQGIPFALGLMNSGRASGTVTIADAYTFGLDNYRLERIVRDWALENRNLLRSYEPREGGYHFLRILSRVYVTGRVSVTVKNDEATGAEAAAGADRPINLLGVKEGSSSENYNKAIEAINVLAEKQLPGAKVKIATATSRSVTLSEEFRKPLVIGYVGFDMPILKGGRVGAPISTLAQLTGRSALQAKPSDIVYVYRLAALSHMYQALKEIPGEEANSIRTKLDTLQQLLPKTYPFSLFTFQTPTEIRKDPKIVAGAIIDGVGFQAVLNYLGNTNTTVDTLERYLQNKTDLQLAQNLKSARDALKEISNRLYHEPVLMQAIDFVFLGN
jgi:hypothetical protein